VLPLLVLVAIVALAMATTLGGQGSGPPAAWTHGALALGVMPLILGAIAYFVPVLTRSGAPPRPVRLAPFLALGGGLLAVLAITGLVPRWGGIAFAAAAGLAAVAAVLQWTILRGRMALGRPHPGLAWYATACGFLMAGLLAALGMAAWPEHYATLRLFHLHLNTLGFVGITAIGTLQVLLPTAAGRPDPQAGTRLQRDLPWAAGGALLVALGAAGPIALAYLGLAVYLVPLVRLGRSWWCVLRPQILRSDGAAPSLALAAAGLLILTIAGGAHGLGWLSGRDAIHAFLAAFLLPLVSGAATQLLPIWLRPGAQMQWHHDLRRNLGRWSALRAGLMLVGGTLLALGLAGGAWVAAAGFALFLAAAAEARTAATGAQK
jgi:hypothetical protein